MVNLALSSKKAFDVQDRILGQSEEIIGERSEPIIHSQLNSVARENVEESLNWSSWLVVAGKHTVWPGRVGLN